MLHRLATLFVGVLAVVGVNTQPAAATTLMSKHWPPARVGVALAWSMLAAWSMLFAWSMLAAGKLEPVLGAWGWS